ncbi:MULTISPECIES: CHAT domain-containing protein [unclassified Microbacterium]|uniref:CHAT domain-containing protein n=1 Tax=unclassified Microbacterium TaxID=2609290 RepID=UPI000EAA76F5|nr:MULTISPECIES: CHAT domain-containing protein [unclassified Microbacterium]MBT2484185.1 CHAT domain-containing protein [Microbacterium sp. ISL-108]RKN67122.1 CHAT domain-containing protein [Microbacterium sp. CGR2]
MPLAAIELHRRGVEAANARRFTQARRALDAASARTDDADLRARIDGTAAYVLAQTGQPAAAERLCRTALRRAGLLRETVALLSGQLGTLLMHGGRLEEAETMLTRAVDALAAASEDTTELANCLMNRSVVRMQRHELDACIEDLRRAVAVYEAAGDEGPLAEATHNLGYAALLGGDLVTALSLMTRSRPTLAASSDLAAAISDLDRAEVLRDAGLTTEAEALLGQVATQFGAQRMRQARAEAEFHLARSLLRHDSAAAERTARAAARRFAALGNDGWAARADAVRLEAQQQARPRSRVDADAFAHVAKVLERRGFRTEAMALRLSARRDGTGRMPRIDESAPTPLRLRAHEVRAARAAASGRHREALRATAEGLDLLAAWQRSFGALDLQASVAMHGSQLMFAGLAAAARLRDPAILFEWSERARHLSQQVAPVRPPHDESLADDLAELRMLRAELAGQDWTTDARVRTLRDRVRERQWATTGSGGTRDRFGLRDTMVQLDPDTAVLSYVFTGSALHCVVVTASGATIVDLSWPRVEAGLDGLRADLDMAALTRGGQMGLVTEKALDARLRLLDADLLAPARLAAPAAGRVVITVPGALGGVPWSMLPGMAGTPFTLAASVSRWLSGRRRSGSSTRVVGLAAGPRVARASEEVRRAAEAWGGRAAAPQILEGQDATVAAVTALATDTDVLHIAAHGRHAVDNPLFSGFELVDGTLFGYDVDLIPRVPEVVILSACELGRSSVRWGEEALGMTRVWLHAGAECVIAAPVAVPDDIACELLSAVHADLARGVEPAVALSAASARTGLRAPFQTHGNGF